MPLGTYTVVAGRDFCGPHDYIEGTIEGIALTGDVPDVGNVDFYLEQGGSIAGSVKDTAGGPLEDFQVVACQYDNGFCMDAFSDNEGNYTITGLPEGDYRVQSGSEWYVTEFFEETYDWNSATRVGVVAGETTPNVNFTLEEGGSLAGMVTDDIGGPIGGVVVIACEYDGGYCMDATTASDGTYRIFAIPASDYRVEAHGEGYQIEFFSETVDPDSATRVPVAVNVITESIDFTLTPD
jgi:hypothetical protein